MVNKENKLWFKAKMYGWGWTPCSWQGWILLLIWAVFFVFSMKTLDHEWLKNLIVVFLLTAGLIYICYRKGEKPCWRWGK